MSPLVAADTYRVYIDKSNTLWLYDKLMIILGNRFWLGLQECTPPQIGQSLFGREVKQILLVHHSMCSAL